MITKEEIKKVVGKIVENYKPEKIYLFGSFAWGKPTYDSDVDLFIIKETREARFKRNVKVRKIVKGELPVDVLVYTQKEAQERIKMGDFFIEDILSKGTILYESN